MIKIIKSLLVFLVLPLLSSCDSDNSAIANNSNELSSQDQKLKRIISDTKLNFNDGDKIMNFSCPYRFMDPIWIAQIQISDLEYKSIKKILNEKKDDTTKCHSELTSSTIWWKPINIIFSKQYLADEHTLVNIIVTKEKSEDVFVLYAECVKF